MLTAVVTYPQGDGLGASVPYHSTRISVRGAWGGVAHALLHDPRHLLKQTFFFPAHDTPAPFRRDAAPGGRACAAVLGGGSTQSSSTISRCSRRWRLGIHGVPSGPDAPQPRLLRAPGSRPVVIQRVDAVSASIRYRHLELQIVFWIPIALLLIPSTWQEGHIRDGMPFRRNGGLFRRFRACTLPYLSRGLLRRIRPAVGAILAPARRFRPDFAFPIAATVTLSIVSPLVTRAKSMVELIPQDDVRHGASPGTTRGAFQSTGYTAGLTTRFGANELNLFPGLRGDRIPQRWESLERKGVSRLAYPGRTSIRCI